MPADFIKNLIVSIVPMEPRQSISGKDIPCYEIIFTRQISNCPECGSTCFVSNGTSRHDVYAIINDKPAYCTLVRTIYECQSHTPVVHHFHNTFGYEDNYFVGRRNCMPGFIRYLLETWLKEKTCSFQSIGEDYGISYSSMSSWANTLKESFDRHFTICTHSQMVFCSFRDKDKKLRGFVGSCSSNVNNFFLLAFIDDYTPEGLMEFFKRIKIKEPVTQVYIDGDTHINETLHKLLNAPVRPLEKTTANLPVDKIKNLIRSINERVIKKDSYENIVIKFLYDTSTCKATILEAIRKTSTRYGSIRIDPAKYDDSFFQNFTGLSHKTGLDGIDELPYISDLEIQI